MINSVWYVVYVEGKKEDKYREALGRKGVVAYVPIGVKLRRVRRKKGLVRVNVPAFGNYVFICLDRGNPNWEVVRSQPEYWRTITDQDGPIEVPEEVVSSIMLASIEGRLDLDKPNWKLIFQKGVNVIVKGGVHAGSFGVVDSDAREDDELIRVAIGESRYNLKVDFLSEIEDKPRLDENDGT